MLGSNVPRHSANHISLEEGEPPERGFEPGPVSACLAKSTEQDESGSHIDLTVIPQIVGSHPPPPSPPPTSPPPPPTTSPPPPPLPPTWGRGGGGGAEYDSIILFIVAYCYSVVGLLSRNHRGGGSAGDSSQRVV